MIINDAIKLETSFDELLNSGNLDSTDMGNMIEYNNSPCLLSKRNSVTALFTVKGSQRW